MERDRTRAGGNIIEKAKRDVLRKFGKFALAALATFGVVKGTSVIGEAANKEIMNTEVAKTFDKLEAESVVIHGGSNLRSGPEIPPSLGDISSDNILAKLPEDNQEEENGDWTIDYKGTVYVREESTNGKWYGFAAEEIANALYETSCIDEKTKDKLIKDKDSTVWINERNVKIIESETSDGSSNR